MRRVLLGLAVLAFAGSALAQRVTDLNTGRHAQLYPDKDHAQQQAKAGFAGAGGSLINHGGPVIVSAKVVSIFWGNQWGSTTNPSSLAQTITSFFANFGTTGEYNVITQYSGIQQTNLTNQYWVDTTNPPTNVTDADVQAEVQNYLTTNRLLPDVSTIYEVFLPSTSYASFGSSDSCGGPNLQFCAYHSNFNFDNVNVKYSSMPYPSCSGCQSSGFTDANNFEHFACHETREAVTDADGTAWYDRRGNEADDKCAWNPTPFIDGGFAYQYEWSNQAGGCVKTR